MTPQQMLATPRGRAIVAAGVVLVLGVVAIAVVASRGDDEAGGATTVAGAASGPSSAPTSAPTSAAAAPPTDGSSSQAASVTTVDASAATSPVTTSAGATTTVAAAPTTTTSPPSPASMVTVPVGTLATVPPVGIDDVGDFGTGLTLEITGIEAIEGEAQLPGEISGPALRVRIQATNRTGAAVSLDHTQVDLRFGADETPGMILSGSGSSPFTGDVASGSSATGTYVFGVPADGRDTITILVTYDVTAPIVVFEGPAPAA